MVDPDAPLEEAARKVAAYEKLIRKAQREVSLKRQSINYMEDQRQGWCVVLANRLEELDER